MKLFLTPNGNDNDAERLVKLLESSLHAHGITPQRRTLYNPIHWLRQWMHGDLAVRIGFGWSDVSRNHGTIAIHNADDDFAEGVALSLAGTVSTTLGTQLRGFRRCGAKPDSREAFGNLRKMHRPGVRHNVLLMVCYGSNEANMASYHRNEAKLVAELTEAIKYWVA